MGVRKGLGAGSTRWCLVLTKGALGVQATGLEEHSGGRLRGLARRGEVTGGRLAWEMQSTREGGLAAENVDSEWHTEAGADSLAHLPRTPGKAQAQQNRPQARPVRPGRAP